MGKVQHVQPKDEKWQVIGEGNEKATKLFDTQKEAVDYARTIAGNQDSNVVIHGTDGKARAFIGGTASEKADKASKKADDKKDAKKDKKALKEEKKKAKEKKAAEKKAEKEKKKAAKAKKK